MSITCRLCGNSNLVSVLDLGASPPCESFLSEEQLDLPEATYPLHLRLCPDCLLLQIPALITPEDTFGGDYAYYSSYSTSWVEHARKFVDQAVDALGLDPDGFVVEVAANDGYLLQHVVNRGIRCLGIEPSVNCSEAARAKGIPMLRAFLDEALAARVRDEHGPADLVVANNVFAHIPDITGFAAGLRGLVADTGRVSIEVHHALSLITSAQFDTIYHEHFQYWTVLAARHGLAAGGLRLVDVELLPTHGGSIRLWAVPEEADVAEHPRVAEVEAVERTAGLDSPDGYLGLAERVAGIRDDLVSFLIEARRAGRRVVAYGAPGQHPPQLLRHPPRSAGLRRGSQHLQTRSIHPRYPHSGGVPGAPHRGLSRRRARAAVESPQRDHRPADGHSEARHPARVATART